MDKKVITKLRIGITFGLLLFGCLFVFTKKANGATGIYLKQVGQTQTTITLAWARPVSAKNIRYTSPVIWVTNCETSQSLTYTIDDSSSRATITNLEPGEKYNFMLTYALQELGQATREPVVLGRCWEAKTLPAKVQNIYLEDAYENINRLDYRWTYQPCADGYEWILYNGSGKIVKKGTQLQAKRCYRLFLGIAWNHTYSLKVRAFTTINNIKYYGEWSDRSYSFAQPKFKVSQKNKKINISWSKMVGATNYTILVKNKNLQTIYKKTVTGTKVTINKIKGKKPTGNYVVFVKANKKTNKKTYSSTLTYGIFSKSRKKFYTIS